MNRVNVFAIHRCINEGYGFIRIFTEKIRISHTKLWRVCACRHIGTNWGASVKTLRISTQALVFPAAEYCAPVWSRSPHVKKVDVAINSSLRTISGCLKPDPVFQLPVLAGIAPAGLRRKAATLALARKAVKHDWHTLHDTTKNEPLQKSVNGIPFNTIQYHSIPFSTTEAFNGIPVGLNGSLNGIWKYR